MEDPAVRNHIKKKKTAKELDQIASFGDTEKLRSGSMPSKSDKLAVQTVQTMPVVQSVFVFFRERSRSGCYNWAGGHPYLTSAEGWVGG